MAKVPMIETVVLDGQDVTAWVASVVHSTITKSRRVKSMARTHRGTVTPEIGFTINVLKTSDGLPDWENFTQTAEFIDENGDKVVYYDLTFEEKGDQTVDGEGDPTIPLTYGALRKEPLI